MDVDLGLDGDVDLTETQATTFAPDVRVNAVAPGPHETEDIEEFLTRRVNAGEFADLTSA